MFKTSLQDDYEFQVCLGGGTYGYVWQCIEKASGRKVAIKVLKEAHTCQPIMRLASREVRMLLSASHPNLIKLLSVFQSRSGRVHLVFEHMETSIDGELGANSPRGLPPAILKAVTWQLLRGVRHLHRRNIMHRDIKPANILMDSSGIVKLCDFGFARLAGCGGAEHTSYVVTRWYRAPEILLGDVYGTSADIWSIGCTIAEMATGAPLFPGTSTVDQLRQITCCLEPLKPQQQHMHGDALAAQLGCPSGGVDPKALRPQPLKSLHRRLSRLDPALLAVVEACLRPNPRDRPSCDELLQMPYFADIPHVVRGTAVEYLLSPPPAPTVAMEAAAPAVHAHVTPEPAAPSGPAARITAESACCRTPLAATAAAAATLTVDVVVLGASNADVAAASRTPPPAAASQWKGCSSGNNKGSCCTTAVAAATAAEATTPKAVGARRLAAVIPFEPVSSGPTEASSDCCCRRNCSKDVTRTHSHWHSCSCSIMSSSSRPFTFAAPSEMCIRTFSVQTLAAAGAAAKARQQLPQFSQPQPQPQPQQGHHRVRDAPVLPASAAAVPGPQAPPPISSAAHELASCCATPPEPATAGSNCSLGGGSCDGGKIHSRHRSSESFQGHSTWQMEQGNACQLSVRGWGTRRTGDLKRLAGAGSGGGDSKRSAARAFGGLFMGCFIAPGRYRKRST